MTLHRRSPIAAPASRLIFGVSEASLRGWRGSRLRDAPAARASGRASAAAPVVFSIVRREVRLIRAYYTGGGPTCQAESGTDRVESARIPAPNRNDRSGGRRVASGKDALMKPGSHPPR